MTVGQQQSVQARRDQLRLQRVASFDTPGGAALIAFGHYYFPDFFADVSPRFHLELADLARSVEGTRDERDNIAGLVIAAPRGHAKSTLLSFLLPIYWLCYRKKRFIVIVSNTATQAGSFVNDIKKQLEENERIRADFGDLCGDTAAGRPLKWTQVDFIAAHKSPDGQPQCTIRVLARSTGAQFRGLRSGAYRPDAILFDDLESDEHIKTQEQRTKIWDWITKAAIPALDPQRGVPIFIGTILHFDSALMRLLALAQREQTYRWRIYKAIDDTGRILWPERFTRSLLDQLKRLLGTLAFNSEYLNVPINEETRLYRPEWIRWYTGNEVQYNEQRRVWEFRGEPLTIVIGVDPAIAEKESSDYFAYVVLGVAKRSKAIVLLYAFADKIDFPAQVQEIIRLETTWQPSAVGIERNAYQRALPQQAMRESVAAKLTIKQIDNTTSKYTRILAASVPFENGQVWMREARTDEAGTIDEIGDRRVYWTLAALYEQMMQYPMSAHDDLLDALENGLQLARRGARAKAFAAYADAPAEDA